MGFACKNSQPKASLWTQTKPAKSETLWKCQKKHWIFFLLSLNFHTLPMGIRNKKYRGTVREVNIVGFSVCLEAKKAGKFMRKPVLQRFTFQLCRPRWFREFQKVWFCYLPSGSKPIELHGIHAQRFPCGASSSHLAGSHRSESWKMLSS